MSFQHSDIMANAARDDLQPLKRNSSYPFLPPSMSELRVVLLGNSWSERSSVGNFILGKTVFNTDEEPTESLRVSDHLKEVHVVLTNTPDLLFTSISEENLRKRVQECLSLSQPGPHVFLLVLQPKVFTEEHKLRLCKVLGLFSNQALDHSLVLITTAEEESSGFKEKDAHNQPLKDMIRMCGYRCLKLRNLELPELLTRLGQAAKEDSGEHVGCDMLKDEDAGLILKCKSGFGHIKPALNLVLCGRRGAGKTSVAKAILGQTEVLSVSNSSVCVQNQGEVCGRQLSLVELPALYGKCPEAVMGESFRCMSLCDPVGAHAFILVLPVDNLTDEDKGELETIQNTFSSQVNDFTMILFTVESDPNSPAVVNFLEKNNDIQDFCQSCGGRHVVLNIKDKQQIPDLLEAVENMTVARSRCFTKDMFTKAQIEKVVEKESINARLQAEVIDARKKTEMVGDDESQSREERILKEKEEKFKQKEEDLRQKHEEDVKMLRSKIKEQQEEIEKEKKLKASQLKDKDDCINKECEKRKKEQEEGERRLKKQEETHRQELKRRKEASEKIIQLEREQKVRKLEAFMKEMKRDREAWAKERKDTWERIHQEDKQSLEELKIKLEKEYDWKRRKWTYCLFGLLLFQLFLICYILLR